MRHIEGMYSVQGLQGLQGLGTDYDSVITDSTFDIPDEEIDSNPFLQESKKLDKEQTETVIMDDKNLNFDKFEYDSIFMNTLVKPKTKFKIFKICLVFLFLLILSFSVVGGVYFYFNKEEVLESKVVDDFCLEFNISDKDVQILLKNKFESEINLLSQNESEIIFKDLKNLTCLPKNSFNEIEEETKERIKSLNRIVITETNIEKIHKNAFSEEVFGNLSEFALQQTQLEEIPDNTFDVFKSLHSLTLANHKFREISNNILGSTGDRVEELILPNNNQLLNFPNFIKFAPNLKRLILRQCSKLNNITESFEDLDKLEQVNLRETPLSNLNISQLRLELGFNETVNIFK